MAVDAGQKKLRRYVVTYENAKCQTYQGGMCARVCMNNEISPFLGCLQSHYVHRTYILVHFFSFSSCEIMFSLFLYAGDVAKCETIDSCIKSRSSIFT